MVRKLRLSDYAVTVEWWFRDAQRWGSVQYRIRAYNAVGARLAGMDLLRADVSCMRYPFRNIEQVEVSEVVPVTNR